MRAIEPSQKAGTQGRRFAPDTPDIDALHRHACHDNRLRLGQNKPKLGHALPAFCAQGHAAPQQILRHQRHIFAAKQVFHLGSTHH